MMKEPIMKKDKKPDVLGLVLIIVISIVCGYAVGHNQGRNSRPTIATAQAEPVQEEAKLYSDDGNGMVLFHKKCDPEAIRTAYYQWKNDFPGRAERQIGVAYSWHGLSWFIIYSTQKTHTSSIPTFLK